MKQTNRIPLVLILFSTFLACGLKSNCEAGDEPLKPGREKTVSEAEDSTNGKDSNVTEGFSLVIKTETRPATEEERDYFLGGESIVIVATLTNVIHNQLVIRDTVDRIDLQFVVKDSESKAVSRTRYGKKIEKRMKNPGLRQGIGLRVPAGKVREYKVYLNRHFDLSLSGTYSVQATCTIIIAKERDYVIANLKSDSLMIEIR